MQRPALARRTPNTGIDLLDTDPFKEYPVRPCRLELGRFHPKNNPGTTWTTTDSKIRDMSQLGQKGEELTTSKCFPLFISNGHSWAGPSKALGEVRGRLLSLVGERFEP